MTESEIISLIRRVIRQEMSPIVMATMVSNESDNRSTVRRYPIEDPRSNVRSVQPFGLASRAPAGMQAFLVPSGNDISNQNVIGHFDDKFKPPLRDGEAALYDAFGHALYLSQGKIQLGSETSSENMVLGQVFKQFAAQVLDLISQHTHEGNLGYQTGPPDNALDFENLKASPIEDEKILSGVAFTEKGS